MHKYAKFTFWITLFLYLFTLITVAYVGVYLTYIAVPLIVVSGLIMRLTRPKENPESVFLVAAKETGKVACEALEDFNEILDDYNRTLSDYNKKNELYRQKTIQHKNKINELRIKKIEPKILLKGEKNYAERQRLEKIISAIKFEIKTIKKEMAEIEKECEREVYASRLIDQSRQKIININKEAP